MLKNRDIITDVIFSVLISIALIVPIVSGMVDFWVVDVLTGFIISCLFFIWLETSTQRFSKFLFPSLDFTNSPIKIYGLFLKQFLDLKAAIFIFLYIAVSLNITEFNLNQMFSLLTLLGVSGVFLSSIYLGLTLGRINKSYYRYFVLLFIVLPVVVLSFVSAVFKLEIPELFLIYPPSVLLIWRDGIEWSGFLIASISVATCLISGYIFIHKIRAKFN